MFKATFRRNRRHLTKKSWAILVILICYIFFKKLFNLQLPNSSNENIIIVNLRSFNHTIPNFIAEESFPQAENINLRLPNELNEPNAHDIPSYNEPEVSNLLSENSQKTDNENKPQENEVFREQESSSKDNKFEENAIIDYTYEAIIKADEDKIIPGLGDGGEPITNVPFIDKQELQKTMKKEAFNKLLSDRISLTRKIPDARHNLCSSIVYDDELPKASVIIIFVNEAWSTLMRTVHSTLIRSPEKHLKEVILVDDASNREELKGKLDYYLKTRLPSKVKLIRLPERNGLIKARLEGAKVASGDVLVFLDSHCECVVGWLEPMLHRIKENHDSVVCPIIDVISDENFAYMFSADHQFQIGGFTWSGHFTWIPIPDFELRKRRSAVDPMRSPTMAGGLFAINREYFWEIGSYDPEMEVWGGENLEMSFRVWQCGGSLEILPCSRVGHIFRSFHPYSFPDRKDTHGINTARMAEVWMDEYKRLFYLYRPDLKEANLGDISFRKELREKLRCRNFKWYLDNVIPQKFILDEGVIAYGRVRSRSRFICFDNLNKPEDSPHDIGIYNCHDKLYTSQFFSMSNKGELRREELCAEVVLRHIPIPGLYGGAKGNVSMVPCSNNRRQIWTYENEIIRNVETGYCIHSYGLKPERLLTVANCRENDLHFKWLWEFVKANNSESLIRNYSF